jgi:GntR family transcriptional repressor for pyruvate dehydrogenase complex
MVEALERMEEDFADEDLRIEADLDFHLAIANATGNPAFRVILVPVMDVLLESRRLGVRISGELTKAISHHQAILDYIRDRDPAGARNAMLEHLDLVSSAMRKALQIEAGRECLG